ncbi:MAG: electron transport complex subunit E [Spirochaetes bacterium]|nr:electron transport complex subunit E [Spirochaetota bacterium]
MSDQTTNNIEIKENHYFKEFSKGIIRENPVFILLLGLCPTLAVTTSLANGLGMGVAATFVLLCSNILVSLLKNFIPEKVRIPSYIVIIASFVTVVDLFLKGYVPLLAASLGIFVPLIVVNCIILGRAEAFANRNTVVISILDALGNGIGFTLALCIIGVIREILGTAAISFKTFGGPVYNFSTQAGSILIGDIEIYKGATIFILPAGAFFVLGVLLAALNAINAKIEAKRKKK